MSKRVLIVDDSPVMRELIQHAASLAGGLVGGLEIEHADDGVSALQTIRSNEAYDAVLLDLNMPVMDGMKLLKFLKDDGKSDGTTVIVVTTEGSEQAEQQARSLGANHFLRKPVVPKELVEILRGALG